jgi:hypothetical protein
LTLAAAKQADWPLDALATVRPARFVVAQIAASQG